MSIQWTEIVIDALRDSRVVVMDTPAAVVVFVIGRDLEKGIDNSKSFREGLLFWDWQPFNLFVTVHDVSQTSLVKGTFIIAGR
jgi:hypothetical protein